MFGTRIVTQTTCHYGAPLVDTVNRRVSFAVLSFITSRHTPAPSTTTRLTIPSHTRRKQGLYALRRGVRGYVRFGLDLYCGELRRARRLLSHTNMRTTLRRHTTHLSALTKQLRATTENGLRTKRLHLGRATTLTTSLGPCNILTHNCTVIRSGEKEVYAPSTLQPKRAYGLQNARCHIAYAIGAIRRLSRDARGL